MYANENNSKILAKKCPSYALISYDCKLLKTFSIGLLLASIPSLYFYGFETMGDRKQNNCYLIKCIRNLYLCLRRGFFLPLMAFLCIPSSAQLIDSSLEWPNAEFL